MMKRVTKSFLLLAVVSVAVVFGVRALTANAFTKTTLDGIDARGDFVLEPAKQEVYLNPGETVVRNVDVTSRITDDTNFDVTVEDFQGTDDPNQQIALLGNERGVYSGKDFIKPEISSFTLKFGEKISFPVTISLPKTAEPKGYYAAVVISSKPSAALAPGQSAKIVSRLGMLFFIRVNGASNESGVLTDFKLTGSKQNIMASGPDGFEIAFKDTGNVHLVPHGMISVTNTIGKQIASLPVDAYAALPDSTRYREIQWTDKNFMLGHYTATLSFYPGYGSTNVSRSVAFWVLPWKVITLILIGIIILVSILYFIVTRFKISFKRKG